MFSIKLLKYARQNGRNMIEMLGVLAIVGILSVGGIAGYSMAMQNHRTNALIEKVQLIAQQARSLYKGDYSSLTSDSIEQLIYAGMIKDRKNPFGGNFHLGRSHLGSDVFGISTQTNLHTVPKDACVKILMADWGSSGVFVGFNLSVTGGKIFLYDTAKVAGSYQYPVTLDQALSTCKEVNRIIWYFK